MTDIQTERTEAQELFAASRYVNVTCPREWLQFDPWIAMMIHQSFGLEFLIWLDQFDEKSLGWLSIPGVTHRSLKARRQSTESHRH
ncbi:hypothetical protein MPTK1_2g02660 [Marchantia polymorpha subsp. ruderalis]|uniref:Uncharacterized protein n=1 Tax=Marchantia polymorpha TaxID=3197 RepID=A0A2R6WM32_MARPO|nr:hypothetical protein MARPO_0075s0029 [Marchantia polymorpha]BBN00851.1 hypothetical protein Mp_2g02660 [Marchantia polymorpha subsp. ruderalis]|eukprot:PTQ34905.1 hypothetical protein MARPO_0075s0029 [Marchantia polymorpha]